MAARRGKSQARRNGGSSGGLPGWAWMIIGIVLTIVVVMLAPRLLKSDGEDGFYRPRANPDALPAPAIGSDDDAAPPAAARPADAPAAPAPDAPLPDTAPDYDFYTLLPGQEVPMTDAELAASARAEEARQREAARRQEDAAELAAPDAPATATAPPQTATPAPGTATPAPGTQDANARYLLQAGSFSASGDAEALKARIALLGLSARVESGTADGRTVYRVRMGPYGSATELAEAKGRLEGGGLPALAIRVQ
ncbi:SPOR domain-containing protein [Luteimonas abyssi]|uniref:SPOR domain-containing protein n=1 Tax=Luteimonas abyssi TaxID=1247514 RepID=UPI000737C471|nr:SPOR domain-containing protein [Luteimonas abyssi]